MEPRKQKFPNSTPAVETPVILSSSLPANFVQFSSSALFPVGSSSTFGSVLSVPIINHHFVAPVQQKQQLPMQSEPLLLLPASALSFSTNSNFVVSTPSQTSRTLPSSVLHSPQLHLNNTRLPLLLTSSNSLVQVDESFTAQQMNQQVIVLPVNGGSGNPTPVLDQASHSKTVPECTQFFSNEIQAADRKNHSYSKKDLKSISTDKSELTKTQIKMKNTNKKLTPTSKSNMSVENSVVDTSSCELSNLDLAQIISNIPSGWKVVGVTGLNQLGLGEMLPSSQTSPSLTSLLAVNPNTAITEATSQVKSEVCLLTEEISPHDQPSLVSVNLNTASQPVASETVFDKWPAKELTCSVKMDDIPCSHVISIKTECIDSNEDNSGNGDKLDCENSNDIQQELAKSNESHPDSCYSKVETNMQLQQSGRKNTLASDNDSPLQDLTKRLPVDSDSCSTQPLLSDSKWTIVGITSLSPLPSTSIATSQASIIALGDSSERSVNASFESNATMLNIPLCQSTVPHANEDTISNIFSKNTLHKAGESAPDSLILNDGNKSRSDIDLYSQTKPEDLKWTIVGVMGSPLTNSDMLNPCVSSGSELLRKSHPTTSCALLPNRFDNVMNNHLLSILPPLSSTTTSPVLMSAGSSPDQTTTIMQGKRQSKSQDTVKKSPKIKVSVNNDDPKKDICSSNSQSQWKIVGVTQLGIPPTTASPIVSVSQLNPISPVMSVPLLIPTASGPVFSNLAAESSCVVTQTTGTIPSSNFLSSLSTLPSLFPQQALPFPVLNLNGTSCNSSLTHPSSPSILGAASSASIQTIQGLAQQQNISQLFQNQLTACQNPINMLTLNESNQWNVVGVVANNQVSLLNPNQDNPPVINTVTTEAKTTTPDEVSHLSVTSTQNEKSKLNISNNDGRKRTRGTPSNKTVTIRQSLSSKRGDSGSKLYHFKCKDIVNKHQRETAKIKKNTVSNLLRIKRMQQGAHENGSSEDGDQSFEEYQEFTETSYEVPQKKVKTRSLRSYAGNRKMFTRTQNKTVDEKISLRSGTQIPVVPSKSEEEELDDEDDGATQIFPAKTKKIDERVPDTVLSVKETQNDDKYSGIKVDAHSSSRRRKLKVPRKLVADLDYHPFDSSSDSN